MLLYIPVLQLGTYRHFRSAIWSENGLSTYAQFVWKQLCAFASLHKISGPGEATIPRTMVLGTRAPFCAELSAWVKSKQHFPLKNKKPRNSCTFCWMMLYIILHHFTHREHLQFLVPGFGEVLKILVPSPTRREIISNTCINVVHFWYVAGMLPEVCCNMKRIIYLLYGTVGIW